MDDKKPEWKDYIEGVKPLPDLRQTAKPKPVSKDKVGAGVFKKLLENQKIAPVKKAISVKEAPVLDRRAESALRKGAIEIDARIDLHGRTESAAYAALVHFVERHYDAGAKCLLVITGKGREGKSVLRANVPRWCEGDLSLARCVKRVYPAAIKHGGDGAFYLMLEKNRKLK